MATFTLYLPGTAATIQYQHTTTEGMYAGQAEYSIITSTVR
jgi:hypothetical protein